jgi:hypothetical protein
LIDFGRFFCDEMSVLIISHIKTCEHCRKGIKELLNGFPMLTMFLPPEKKKTLLDAINKLGETT